VTAPLELALHLPLDDIEVENVSAGASQVQFLYKYLKNIGSYNLNVAGAGNQLAGYRAIGGAEFDTNGLKALGYDYNGDGKGTGYSILSILGIYNLQPYYHNGACETLLCVVSDPNHVNAGLGAKANPLAEEKARRLLVKFLESIDLATTPF
jgi:hypothetical protein